MIARSKGRKKGRLEGKEGGRKERMKEGKTGGRKRENNSLNFQTNKRINRKI